MRRQEVPTYDERLNPTLRALHELGGSGSINEIVDQVIADLRLPKARSPTRANQTAIEYRLAWARTYGPSGNSSPQLK